LRVIAISRHLFGACYHAALGVIDIGMGDMVMSNLVLAVAHALQQGFKFGGGQGVELSRSR
jgi:hypothetical protein